MRVAIKTLKPSATAKTRQDFFREADLMVELKHPNIVGLLGVCTKDEPRCMLFEYMTQVGPMTHGLILLKLVHKNHIFNP